MPLITWTPAYSVGHPDLDQDHQNLVDLLNMLHEAWETGEDLAVRLGIVDELLMYTDYHFRREEGLLAEHGYPRLADQQAAHAALRQSVEDFRSRHLSHPDTALTAEIETFLKTWMMSHILEEDLQYRSLFAD